MTRCKSSWGALACVLGIYAIVGVAVADVLPRAETALKAANEAKNAAARCEYHAGKGVAEATDPLDKADFVKAGDDCRKLKNEGAQAEYAIEKIIARAKAPPPAPDPDPAPTDPSPPPQDPEPQPQPDPVPSDPLPPGSITIDGVRLLPVSLGSITTPTGAYPAFDLGKVADGKAYLVRDAKADAGDVCVAAAPDGDGSIEERAYAVNYANTNYTLRVLPGSLKCLGRDLPSAAPSMERLRKAVAEKRVLPYSAAAFAGWRWAPDSKVDRTTLNKLGYKPERIYGKSSSASALPWTISGAGGEYETSRGFLAGTDAQMIAAALSDNAAMFAETAAKAHVEVLYGLSLPNLAIWSDANDTLRDPQHPLPGDRRYFNEGTSTNGDQFGNEGKWCAPADYPWLAEIEAKAGTCYDHGRNAEHLFNHGYAYWLATGDPRAALLQQAIAAYALASPYEGGYADGRYRTKFGYQRWTLNMLSAMWKLRDVSLHASGSLLWPRERSAKMWTDVVADWEAKVAAMDAASDGASVAMRVLGSVDNTGTGNIINFMTQGYGPEAAYLWASAGRPAMLERMSRNMAIRFGLIGGTRGIYGKGSGVAFKQTDSVSPLPWRDAAGLAAWVNASNTLPADSFDGAAQHTVQRAYWLLKMGEDAARRGWMPSNPMIGKAIAAMEAARAKVAPNKDSGVVGWKHAGVPFDLAK